MNLSDFNYNLPKELIAQFPCDKRDESRLLVLDRKSKSLAHKKFYNAIDYLNPGDVLVLNNTKVILARLFGHRKKTKGKIELLLLEKTDKKCFRALIKPLKRLKADEDVIVDNDHGLTFKLVDFDKRIVEFSRENVLEKLDDIGHVPLPQYIKRSDSILDRTRYQTVYAKKEGAVAAPTAGLHFTQPLLKKIRDKGINVAFITLHVGYATFSPIREEDISKHKMGQEYYHIPQETIKSIRQAKDNSKKIVGVGTTVCRALESSSNEIINSTKIDNTISGYTNLFIHPPFKFRIVDSLITNFHLPESSLYILVAAFAGLANIRMAYRQAVENRYRFFSYGDAMLIK